MKTHSRNKKTRIIATLGPASTSPAIVRRLIQAGTDVFRLNFSHGSTADHAASIKTVRNAAAKHNRAVSLMADLQGPKIRTGRTNGDRDVILKRGHKVVIGSAAGICTDEYISVPYPPFLKHIKAGHILYINDGAVKLKVLTCRRSERKVDCRVLAGGVYSSRKGVNFPDTVLDVPALTTKDKKDLEFILKNDIDMIALSFTRKAADILTLKRLLTKVGRQPKVIAKIEKPEAIKNMKEIIHAADGIMVARGDLGIEMSPSKVPLLQKQLLHEANLDGKLTIVATQMLESMIKNSSATRAESSDVANAILDGTDACMLSGETAVGIDPVLAVSTMKDIAESTEASDYYPDEIWPLDLRHRYPPHSICEAAAWASQDLDGVPVIVLTESGETASYLAKTRNQSPIYAFSPRPEVVNFLAACWNTRSFLLSRQKSLKSLESKAEKILLSNKLVKKDDTILIVGGTGLREGTTNFLRVKKVGEEWSAAGKTDL